MDPSAMKVVFEVEMQITGRHDFGVDPVPLLKGLAPIPRGGVRYDIIVKGRTSGAVQGSITGIDYFTLEADNIGRHGGRYVIETDDGARIAWQAEGVAVPQAKPMHRSLHITGTFYTGADRYQWLCRAPVWAVGQVDSTTGRVHLKAYAASQEMTTSG